MSEQQRPDAEKDATPDEAQEVQKPPPVEDVVTPNFKRTYANIVQVQTSQWDVHINFSEVFQRSNRRILEHRVAIAISVEMAKALAKILSNQLENYENQHGAINPKHDQPASA